MFSSFLYLEQLGNALCEAAAKGDVEKVKELLAFADTMMFVVVSTKEHLFTTLHGTTAQKQRNYYWNAVQKLKQWM